MSEILPTRVYLDSYNREPRIRTKNSEPQGETFYPYDRGMEYPNTTTNLRDSTHDSFGGLCMTHGLVTLSENNNSVINNNNL